MYNGKDSCALFLLAELMVFGSFSSVQCHADVTDNRPGAFSNFYNELSKPGNQTPEKFRELKRTILEPAEHAYSQALGAAINANTPQPKRPGRDLDRDSKIIELKQQVVKELNEKPPSAAPDSFWTKMRGQLNQILGTGGTPTGTSGSSQAAGTGSAPRPPVDTGPAKEEVVLDGSGIVKEIEFTGRKNPPPPQKKPLGR